MIKIISPRKPRYYADNTDMLTYFGVQGTQWPREGIQPRTLPGFNTSTQQNLEVLVWVAPFKPRMRKNWNNQMVEVKSSTHRVRCRCPGCGREMSAGRLFQHLCPA